MITDRERTAHAAMQKNAVIHKKIFFFMPVVSFLSTENFDLRIEETAGEIKSKRRIAVIVFLSRE